MNSQTIENTVRDHAESYVLIKDEHLSMIVISSQILAGSKIALSTYENVVFSECSFYATEFQGVTFKDCVFENCNIAFSHMKKCKFINCSFENCTWNASSAQVCLFENCATPLSMDESISQGTNEIKRIRDDYSTDIYIEFAVAA